MSEEGAVAPAIAGYRVERLLGVGGQSQVWFGTTADGDPVAVKVLAADASRRELEALRRHRHRHLVGLREVSTTSDGRPALVLDYLAGGSLAQLVGARGPLDPGEVVTIVTPLADLLHELHAAGVVHGDVTPGNVLFGQDGRPLLCDLGIATVAGVEPRTHGTDGFTVDAGAGPAADVYGLAACAWFALTAGPPASGAVRPPLRATHPGLPGDLVDVIEEALLVDEELRPTAAELARRVFAVGPARAVELVPVDPEAPALHVVTGRLRRREPEAVWDDLVASPVAVPRQATGPDRTTRTFDRQRLRRLPAEPPRRLPRRGLVVAAVIVVGVLAGGGAAMLWWPGPGPSAQSESGVRGASFGEAGAEKGADASGVAGPSGGAAASENAGAGGVDAPVESVAPGTTGAGAAADSDAGVLEAVEELSARRAAALTTHDRGALATIDAPGSPALAADLSILDELSRRSLRYAGLSFELAGGTLVSRDGSSALVAVTTTTQAHDVLDADGAVVASVPTGAPRQVTVRLTRTEAGWRVHEVLSG